MSAVRFWGMVGGGEHCGLDWLIEPNWTELVFPRRNALLCNTRRQQTCCNLLVLFQSQLLLLLTRFQTFRPKTWRMKTYIFPWYRKRKHYGNNDGDKGSSSGWEYINCTFENLAANWKDQNRWACRDRRMSLDRSRTGAQSIECYKWSAIPFPRLLAS